MPPRASHGPLALRRDHPRIFSSASEPTAPVQRSRRLFGAIHVDSLPDGSLLLFRLASALVVDIGLGLLRLRAGSLAPPMLARGLLNAITFSLAPLVEKPLGAPESEATLGWGPRCSQSA